jgi:allantoinase
VSAYDLVVRGGTLVGVGRADLAVLDGAIAAIGPELAGGAARELDARGLHVLPGGLDPHVHFNEPGRTDWEGFATGTAALAAGGMTACFDMPLNSTPPTVDGAAFDAKVAAARVAARVDYGLWGGLVAGRLDRLEELAERGVVGFKAFMSASGIADFPAADDLTLLEGMAEAARLGLPVAVHAENDALTSGLAARALAAGRGSARDFAESRPLLAELDAVARAIGFASATGCALHVVHVSSGSGVGLVAQARAGGVDVTCETCPHYLVLGEADVEAIGAAAKCAPPVRDEPERAALWERMADVAFVASDHSPSPPELKAGSFFAAWGGIAGCQTTLPVLLGERRLALEEIVRLLCVGAAERFRIPGRGRLEVGADADLALVDLAADHVLAADDLRYRHPVSAWVGRRLRARVVGTLLRGADPLSGPPAGRLLKPVERSTAP